MTDVLSLTASQILAITQPEALFGRPESVSDLYKALVKRWHPDIGGDVAVLTNINLLHQQAKQKIEAGIWQVPGELSFKASGKEYRLRYFKEFEFELGKAYLSKTKVTYVIQREFADLVQQARKIIGALHYPDDQTKAVMARYMPSIAGCYETEDSIILMIEKPADLIRMRDLLEHCGGKIDAKHVAWMVSRLLNHASYFEWAKISHADLSLDSLFVCPEQHTVCVLGGWWYATAIDEKPLALPQRTVNNAPSEVINNKKASLKTDPELVRLVGRELLGNPNGIHLMKDATIPKQMLNWLRISGNGSAIKDYAKWRDSVLIESFGPRKFVKMPISSADVYDIS